MRYKEGERVLFKFCSIINDPNDYSVGEIVTQMDTGLPDWKDYGEYYYIVKTEGGWSLDEGHQKKIKELVGENVYQKLIPNENYWFVREKNIFGIWDGENVLPELLNFRLLRHKFRK